MRARALYLIGGSALCLPTIRTAQRLGWRVICTDKDVRAPGLQEADLPVHIEGTSVDGHLWVARDVARQPSLAYDIQACYCPASFGLPALRAIRAALGLPDNPPEIYELLEDKQRVQEALQAAGILTPWAFAERCERWVVKPRKGSGGSVGVAFVSTEDLASMDTTGYLVEPYVEGRLLDANVLRRGGKSWTAGVIERVALPGPHPVPMVGWTIGRGHDATLVLDRACDVLGIDEGPVKADMLLTRDGRYLVVLEVEPRFHGDISTAACLPAIGVDPMAMLLGGEPREAWAGFAAWWTLWLPEGRLLGEPHLPRTRGVTSLWWNPKVRERIEAPTSTVNIPGYLAIAGSSREEVWALREAWALEAAVEMELVGAAPWDDLGGLLLRL